MLWVKQIWKSAWRGAPHCQASDSWYVRVGKVDRALNISKMSFCGEKRCSVLVYSSVSQTFFIIIFLRNLLDIHLLIFLLSQWNFNITDTVYIYLFVVFGKAISKFFYPIKHQYHSLGNVMSTENVCLYHIQRWNVFELNS